MEDSCLSSRRPVLLLLGKKLGHYIIYWCPGGLVGLCVILNFLVCLLVDWLVIKLIG